jgi:hypothetical protein
VGLEILNNCAGEGQQQFTRHYAADAQRVICNIGNTERRTPVRELHVAFKIPYVYDRITKLYTEQAEVIQIHLNPEVIELDKEKP